MRTDVTVRLGDSWLHEINAAIAVQSVREGATVTGRGTAERMSRYGSHYGKMGRPYMEIAVDFSVMLHGRNRLQTRAQVLDAVRAWAMAGGALRVSYRPGQHIDVVCDGLPETGDITQWTGSYTITFKAFDVPCWVMDTPSSGTASGATGSISLTNGGTAAAPVSIRAENNGTVKATYALITGEDGSFIRVNTDIEAGKALCIDYAGGVQQIYIENSDGERTSALHRRSNASADDILLDVGTHTVTVASDVSLDWTASVRGWMI